MRLIKIWWNNKLGISTLTGTSVFLWQLRIFFQIIKIEKYISKIYNTKLHNNSGVFLSKV